MGRDRAARKERGENRGAAAPGGRDAPGRPRPPRPPALTPVLRSKVPPEAAVSLVVLSPTREGSVCDIQLVIMAMVLRTTPILSKGTDMSAGGGAAHPSFCTGAGLHAAGDGLRQPPDHRHRLSPPAHRPKPRHGPARGYRGC